MRRAIIALAFVLGYCLSEMGTPKPEPPTANSVAIVWPTVWDYYRTLPQEVAPDTMLVRVAP